MLKKLNDDSVMLCSIVCQCTVISSNYPMYDLERICTGESEKYRTQSAHFLLSLWMKSLSGVLFSSELYFMMSIHLILSITNHNECDEQIQSSSLSLPQSVIAPLHIFIFIICHYKKWAIFVTTAVFSNFYSTNSSQSPFNGISINLLNGFKNSLTLMWVSEILMWTLKMCSRCAQFDRISSVSARLSRDWAWWS